MKAIIGIFAMILSMSLLAQDYEKKLNSNFEQVSKSYELIKDFRNEINDTINQTMNTCDSLNVDTAYSILFDRFKENGIKLKRKDSSLPESVFSQVYSENFSCDTLLFVVAKVDQLDYYHEKRLFAIEFDALPYPISINSIYIDEYNQALASVGRRFGRLIQSAILEDEDYVTPSSQTRLDLAISDLKLAEFNLRRAIEQEEYKTPPDTVIIVNNYYLPKDRSDLVYFFGASTNLEQAFGINSLFSWQRTGFHFDTGLDLFLSFETELDVLIHPKIGVPVDDFHFLAGLLFSANNGTATLTGNVYYSRDRLYGGVGFGKNTVLFTVGFVGWD